MKVRRRLSIFDFSLVFLKRKFDKFVELKSIRDDHMLS